MDPANLIFFTVLLLVSSLIAAMLIRAAVTLLNRFVWSQSPVREPLFTEAFGIAAMTFLIGAFAGSLVAGMLEIDGRSPRHAIMLMYASIPMNVIVLAALTAYKLQTSFGRGLAVSALQTALQFLIAAGCFTIYALAGGL